MAPLAHGTEPIRASGRLPAAPIYSPAGLCRHRGQPRDGARAMQVEITEYDLLDKEMMEKVVPRALHRYRKIRATITDGTVVLSFAGSPGTGEAVDRSFASLVGSVWVLNSIDEATGTLEFGMAAGTGKAIPKIRGGQ